MHQRARDQQTPLHAARQYPCLLVVLFPEAKLAEVFFRALPGQLVRHAVVTALGDDDVQHLLEQVEVDFLRYHAQVQLGGVGMGFHILAEDLDSAAGLANQGRDDANDRGLAGAIGPQQREEITLGDIKGNAVKRLVPVVVSFLEIAE